jgi:hypothetical protein
MTPRRNTPVNHTTTTRSIAFLLGMFLLLYFPRLPGMVVMAGGDRWGPVVVMLRRPSRRSPLEVAPFMPRGGSSTTTKTTTESAASYDKAYSVRQQLSLQSRSLQLRQALLARGLTELSHTTTTEGANSPSSHNHKQAVDWDCALSTPEHPKSCLYSLDAEYGQKVIAPRMDDDDDTSAASPAWITLTALNRLYRTDPAKVDSLWYHQYDIVSTWFQPHHRYSLYAHYRNPVAALVTAALNVRPPWLLGCVTLSTVGALLLLLLGPLVEALGTTLLTSRLLWQAWPTWGRFVHAALPLQLLLGQLALGAVGSGLQLWTRVLRSCLVEYECQALQAQLPRTRIEEETVVDDDDAEVDVEDHFDNVDDDA